MITANSFPKQTVYVNRNVFRAAAFAARAVVKIETRGFSDGGGDRNKNKRFLFPERGTDELLREIRRDAERIRLRNAGKSENNVLLKAEESKK